MKTVRIINSISIIFLCSLVVCCKQKKNRKEKTINSSKENIHQVYNCNNIITNKREKGFDWNLIDSLTVKEGDTVLFYKMNRLKPDSIKLINKGSTYNILLTDNLNYYKTGVNKFSSFKMNLKDINTNISFDFYTYVNHYDDDWPYNPNNMTSHVKVIKTNDSLAKFDVQNDNLLEYDIYFKINKNNTLAIFKIFIQDNWEDKVFTHQLDTLININKDNKFIRLKELQYLTTVREKH